VNLRAVIFDWGGTLTPWHQVDLAGLWHEVLAQHLAGEEAAQAAAAIHAAERELWELAGQDQSSWTLSAVFERAGVQYTDALLATYSTAWEPHTFIDPDVPELFRYLRERDLKIGVLSNTFWPRSWHEEIFRRDGVLDLIDGAVYTSEIGWTKPHPEAFQAAMAAVGVSDPASCVFVGDRPFDDIYGAGRVGMRTVFVPHSGLPPFEGSAPDAVISRLAELPALLDQW
jgi:putative hydrolase of the HAD superfamily